MIRMGGQSFNGRMHYQGGVLHSGCIFLNGTLIVAENVTHTQCLEWRNNTSGTFIPMNRATDNSKVDLKGTRWSMYVRVR